MKYENVYEKILTHQYDVDRSKYASSKDFLPDSHVEDEDKSVKWNREFVKQHNRAVKEDLQKYGLEVARASLEFNQDLISAISESTDFNNEICSMIFERAYSEGRSAGYSEVVSRAIDLSNFVRELIDSHLKGADR